MFILHRAPSLLGMAMTAYLNETGAIGSPDESSETASGRSSPRKTFGSGHLFAQVIHSPLGPMIAVTEAEGRLLRLDFAHAEEIGQDETQPTVWQGLTVYWVQRRGSEIDRQIGEYFDGSRRRFDIPLSLRLGTQFSQRVWRELLTIPFGETTTYGRLAAKLGRPGASRAIGRANGANPISLIVPCHRVIAADGSLAGYSSGTHLKRALLHHEFANHANAERNLYSRDATSR